MKIDINKILRFYRIGILKSLYFNFTCLPFKQAIKFPVIVTRYTKFYELSGKIIINVPVRPGLIRIGYNGEDTISYKNERALIKIKGNWIVNGDIHLGVGVVLRIEQSAVLETYNNIRLNFRNKIICYQNIKLGENLNTSWEVQIMDSDLHFLRNKETNELYDQNKPIVIGRNVWIGNRCTITKGTSLPDNCIVASNSLCNKQYNIPEYSIIGGIPAKLLKTNIYRPFEEEN